MISIKVDGFRFNKEYLKKITLKRALIICTNEPKDTVEKAWRLANGKEEKKVAKKKKKSNED